MIKSITLLGSSSGRNAGDAALISSIMDSIDEALGRKILYEIPTINPKFILNNYANNTKPISMMPWSLSIKMLGVPTFRSILRTDLTLIFDAVLFDKKLYNPFFNFLSSLYLLLPLAKKRGKKMAFYSVGAGPIDTKHGKKMLCKLSCLMDFITVRDNESFNLLKNIGSTNPQIIVTADAAVNLKPSSKERACEILKSKGIDTQKEILALNINRYLNYWVEGAKKQLSRDEFLDIYAEAISEANKTIGAQIVIVSTQHHDLDICKELSKRIKTNSQIALVNNVEYSHYDVKAVLGLASLLFGMRLHALILASSALTPITGLEYKPKVRHYLSSLGLEDFNFSFHNFSKDTLVSHLIYSWKNRASIKSKICEVMPKLQESADMPAQIIKAMDD